MSSSFAAVASGLELRDLKNRPLKRKANSEICKVSTKRRKICSHHPKVVVEKLDSSDSYMEIDGYLAQLEGLHKALERLGIEDHGAYPAFGNLHNRRVAMKHIPKKDLNVSPPIWSGLPSSSAIEERFDHNTTTSTFLKTLSKAEFEAIYEELDHLGKGGFGSVWAGNRKRDNQPVAIKHILMKDVMAEENDHLPTEIALMLKVQGERGTASPVAAVHLLDWFKLDQELILVLERPVPSTDLLRYMKTKGGLLEEQEATMIMQQVIKAIIDIHSKGVLHRDIKPENILIETSSNVPRVWIIDFGCGCLLHNGEYHQYSGTSHYYPPEWFKHQSYRAEPITVWQVGVLVYCMLVGKHPFSTKKEIISKEPCIGSRLSPNCQEFVWSCLAKKPQERLPLDCLLRHPWLQ